MSMKSKLPVAIVSAVLVLSTGSAAFAKAHDQGVADGMPTPDNTGQFVQDTGFPGVSEKFNKGQRGEAASGNGGDNRIEPVVGNGANAEPD